MGSVLVNKKMMISSDEGMMSLKYGSIFVDFRIGVCINILGR